MYYSPQVALSSFDDVIHVDAFDDDDWEVNAINPNSAIFVVTAAGVRSAVIDEIDGENVTVVYTSPAIPYFV